MLATVKIAGIARGRRTRCLCFRGRRLDIWV